ncbi:hypothetical protein D9M72_124340 [compost metagenome]
MGLYTRLNRHRQASSAVASSAYSGTPLPVTYRNTAGAWPSAAMLNSIRVAAYMPELPADSTEVRMTAFITVAADSSPACWNTRVKGLTAMSSTSLRSSCGSV